MSGMRQKIQYALALVPKGRGEAPVRGHQGTEPPVAKPAPESPACAERLIEEVCDRGNLVRAWKRVRSNRGSPGVDGMTIAGAKAYLREHWPNIRSQLLSGTYQPQPVHGHLGNSAEARAALDEFMRRSPVLTATDERLNRPFGTPAQRERFLEGLRRAGLPYG